MKLKYLTRSKMPELQELVDIITLRNGKELTDAEVLERVFSGGYDHTLRQIAKIQGLEESK